MISARTRSLVLKLLAKELGETCDAAARLSSTAVREATTQSPRVNKVRQYRNVLSRAMHELASYD